MSAPNPQCSALAAAKQRSGLSYADIATKINKSEQHVIDGVCLYVAIDKPIDALSNCRVRIVCTGKSKPTDTEFNALAQALGIQNVSASAISDCIGS